MKQDNVENLGKLTKEIEIEEAKNQEIEKIPVYQKYYMLFTRNKGTDWFASGIASTDKNNVIRDARNYWANSEELKIISFELPS